MTAPGRAPEALIGFELITEIIETALYSAYLKGTIPLSAIVIGPSGGGKSKSIMQYGGTNGCHLTNDITSSGLQEILERDHEGKIRTLIIPDFNVVLSHRASTLQLTIANLLSVTSEGTVRIDDGREKKETKHLPVGIITAMTRELYMHVARKWAILGFNRRFIPIFFEYSVRTRQQIQDSIASDTVSLLQLLPREIHRPAYADVSIPKDFSQRIQGLSDDLSNNIGWIPNLQRRSHKAKEPTKDYDETKPRADKAVFVGKALEFTPHLALRSMARAHALKEGRQHVEQPDINFLMALIEFTRYDQPGKI
jgi:hypothetical protein